MHKSCAFYSNFKMRAIVKSIGILFYADTEFWMFFDFKIDDL